jgi:hypothetical protein
MTVFEWDNFYVAITYFQIFGNAENKSKPDSGGNEEEIELG